MRNLQFSRRPGFTLIEVLVVAGLVFIAVSLATPAIQRARQQSRATTCKNNLKMIGLALHNYHDVYNGFPGAWYARFPQADSPRWMGWQTSLLPYVEHAGLYNQISETGRTVPEWPDDGKLARTAIPEYLCPMDTTGPQNPFRDGFGTANYSGNFGPDLLPRWYESSAEQFWPGAVSTPTKTNGIFCVNSITRFRDIIDGTSNTAMVSERSARSGAGLWIGVRSNRSDNDAITDMNSLSGINKSYAGFSSRHEGAVNILICDGSVRLIREDIDSKADGTGTLQRLSDRRDGQVIGEF